MHAYDNVCQTCELTYVIGHANASLHLWKFKTWRFICRGLTVCWLFMCPSAKLLRGRWFWVKVCGYGELFAKTPLTLSMAMASASHTDSGLGHLSYSKSSSSRDLEKAWVQRLACLAAFWEPWNNHQMDETRPACWELYKCQAHSPSSRQANHLRGKGHHPHLTSARPLSHPRTMRNTNISAFIELHLIVRLQTESLFDPCIVSWWLAFLAIKYF